MVGTVSSGNRRNSTHKLRAEYNMMEIESIEVVPEITHICNIVCVSPCSSLGGCDAEVI